MVGEKFGEMKDLLKQARTMQDELKKKQQEIEKQTFEATGGGGMVTVRMNGRHEILELKIDTSIVDAKETPMLEDLIIAAVNDGYKKVDRALQEQLSGMLGGLSGLKNLFPS